MQYLKSLEQKKNYFFHGFQSLKRKFQAHFKQEEHNTQLAQHMNEMQITDPIQSERPYGLTQIRK